MMEKIAMDRNKTMIWYHMNDIHNKVLQKVTRIMFEKMDPESPAAINYHHTEMGGVRRHITEMLETYKALRCYDSSISKDKVLSTTESRDRMIAAIIIHDFGKGMDYYRRVKVNGPIRFERVPRKPFIAHTHTSLVSFIHYATKEGLDIEEINWIARLIETHHGLREWNAYEEPQTKEEHLLHQLDMISTHILGKT